MMVVAARHRRRLAAGIVSALATSTAVVLGALVVAVGGTPPPAAAGAGVIPAVALDAYRRAADSPAGVACGLRWEVLAGVGKVESDHAAGHSVTPSGDVSPPIIGLALDGTGGRAAVADTDRGRLDGDGTSDRAVGPMQFLPASWAVYGVDATGDGLADPQNLYDATAAATAKLCAGRHLDSEDALRAALLAYNPSQAYVDAVRGWIAAYEQAPAPAGEVPAATGSLVDVGGIVVDAALAPGLGALLEAAKADSVALNGEGYRSHDAQVALRRAHCGTSTYATFEMASEQCSPPTARPGESRHEAGLAVDFRCAGALVTRSSPCFAWLVANASRFGLYGLASEPWHWSADGR